MIGPLLVRCKDFETSTHTYACALSFCRAQSLKRSRCTEQKKDDVRVDTESQEDTILLTIPFARNGMEWYFKIGKNSNHKHLRRLCA